jgi:hypothetical protein
MRYFRLTAILLLLSFVCIGLTGTALAENEVGSIVAKRGKAIIERDNKSFEAEVQDNLFMNDTVSTKDASRVKMLFIDDSVLTLGENSQVVIKEVIYSKHKMGRSVFSLVEGKMRSVVGKTQFEVHTPTAVAAARGTVILTETGVLDDGRTFTVIICVEGETLVRPLDPRMGESVTLTAGMMLVYIEGEHFPSELLTEPTQEIQRLQNSTESDREISIPGPAEIYVGPEGAVIEPSGMTPPQSPPIDQQPLTPPTTPVDINVIFPEQ